MILYFEEYSTLQERFMLNQIIKMRRLLQSGRRQPHDRSYFAALWRSQPNTGHSSERTISPVMTLEMGLCTKMP